MLFDKKTSEMMLCKSILYDYFSIAALEINSSAPFFQVLYICIRIQNLPLSDSLHAV